MYSGDFHQKAVITSNNAWANAGLGRCAQVPTRSRATRGISPGVRAYWRGLQSVCRGYRFTVRHRESGKRGAGGKPIQPKSPPNRAPRGRLLGAPLPPHRLILGVSRVRPSEISREPQHRLPFHVTRNATPLPRRGLGHARTHARLRHFLAVAAAWGLASAFRCGARSAPSPFGIMAATATMATSGSARKRLLKEEDMTKVEFETSEEVDVTPTFDTMGLREDLLRGIYAYGRWARGAGWGSPLREQGPARGWGPRLGVQRPWRLAVGGEA